jgi:hypothetical protein
MAELRRLVLTVGLGFQVLALPSVGLLTSGCDLLNKFKKDDASAKKDSKDDESEEDDSDKKKKKKKKKDDGDKAGDTDKDSSGAKTPTPTGGGVAYAIVDGRGLVEIRDGAIKYVKEDENLFFGLREGQDGNAYFRDYKGISRIEPGGALKQIASYGSDFDCNGDDYTVLANGNIWVTSFKGVCVHDGKWTKIAKDKLGSDVKLLKGVAVDAKNRVVVASSEAIHIKDGDNWKAIKPSKREFFQDVIAVKGEVFALSSSALYKLVGDDIKAQDIGDRFYSASHLAVSQNGQLAFNFESQKVATLIDGKAKTFDAKSEMGEDHVTGIGMDNQGRVWLGSRTGLYLFGPGGAKQSIPTGSFIELSGEIRSLVVLGDGPSLPKPGAIKKASVVRGKALKDNEPLANADVELCANPSFLIRTTPCADAKSKFTGKSDAKGEFEFKDVPLGSYSVAVKNGKDWSIGFGSSVKGLKEGGTFDLGTIKVKSK